MVESKLEAREPFFLFPRRNGEISTDYAKIAKKTMENGGCFSGCVLLLYFSSKLCEFRKSKHFRISEGKWTSPIHSTSKMGSVCIFLGPHIFFSQSGTNSSSRRRSAALVWRPSGNWGPRWDPTGGIPRRGVGSCKMCKKSIFLIFYKTS